MEGVARHAIHDVVFYVYVGGLSVEVQSLAAVAITPNLRSIDRINDGRIDYVVDDIVRDHIAGAARGGVADAVVQRPTVAGDTLHQVSEMVVLADNPRSIRAGSIALTAELADGNSSVISVENVIVQVADGVAVPLRNALSIDEDPRVAVNKVILHGHVIHDETGLVVELGPVANADPTIANV
jgi:hypothetical protein